MATKRRVEARRWFQQASYDLKAVKWNVEGGFYDTACFLAQHLHYIPSRYPNGLPSGYPHQFYSKDVAAKALKAGEAIVEAVKNYYQGLGENDILRD